MLLKRLFYFLIISFCTLFASAIQGQSVPETFDFIGVKEGISKVGIATITQDHYGFIWIGTYGSGLYKFDGVDYVSYKHRVGDTTSLSSNLVYCTFIDSDKNLWIGTEDGLNRYDRDFDRFEVISPKDENQDSDAILSIGETKDGILLLGTNDQSLFTLHTSTLETVQIFDDQDSVIPKLSGIKNHPTTGVSFIATANGLKVFNENKNQLSTPSTSLIDGEVLDISIQTLVFDLDHNLWLGTNDQGIYKLTFTDGGIINRVDHFPLSRKRILSATIVSDGSLLFGSENDGLFHLTSNGQVINQYRSDDAVKPDLQANSIWSLFVDKSDRIWLGYYNNGVAVHDSFYDKFNTIESIPYADNSLTVGSVTGIEKDNSGNIWMVMDGGGIDIYNPLTTEITHINTTNNTEYKGLTSDYLQTIFIDSNENIWVGSWDSGIFLLKKGANVFKNYTVKNTNGALASDAILSFAEDATGTIIIGSFYGGLHTYDPKTETITSQKTQALKNTGNDIRKVLVGRDNTLYLGTTNGLYKAKNNAHDIRSFVSLETQMTQGKESRKSANHILSLYESNDGILWIGTRGAGLCAYDPEKNTFEWYTKERGLQEENVVSIIEDNDGAIWLGGNTGIIKFNRKAKTFKNYTITDGLLSNDFNFNAVLKEEDGTLYFGNYRGVDFFNPKNIVVNQSVPALYLTGLKIFNKTVHPFDKNTPLQKVITETEHIKLTHQQSVFTIEYTGVSFTRPEKNQYAYYLEGLEDSWNYVGNLRAATYTNLDHGDYVFKVKVANNDGVWNDNILELNITVRPPWWQTNLAIFIYILLVLSGLYLLNKIAKARIREKEALSNERAQREQEELLHEKKLQFFTNISHEFRTPLTLMINPLKDIINDTSLNLPDRIRDKHQIIYKNTDRLHRLINELMDLRKLELNKQRLRARKINVLTFVSDVVSYFKEESFSRNIYLYVDADLPAIPLYADENVLEKVIFNILSNAMKVTPEGGAVTVEVNTNEDGAVLPLVHKTQKIPVVEIVIRDTGPGLKKKQVKRIFERFYQVENLNKTYYGGTGIGLEVVKSFVQLHRGKIEVESTVGQGTTFKVLLPSGKAHLKKKEIWSSETTEALIREKENITINSTTREKTAIDTAVKAHTLLIVEDNTALREYLRTELRDTYKIVTAINGVKGLQVAQTANPDIIITDVIMPEMDGFEFCKRIKSDLKTSHIPLLMLTAKATIDDRIDGIGYGADAYMVKPFDLRLLRLRLAQLVTSRQLIFDKYFGAISGSDENTNATSIDKDFIQSVLSHINDNMSDPALSVESLAAELHLSRSQLYRKIKTLTGQTVNEFVRKLRLERAKKILETENANVSEVCYKVGFSSPSYFTKCFKAHFGMLPTAVQPID